MLKYIHADILRAYQSLEQPRWGFVERARRKEPYRAILEALAGLNYQIVEETDINDDVSFVYLVSSARGCMNRVGLSMVGRYAYVEVITSGCDEEAGILTGVLDAEGLYCLDQRVLRRDSPIRGADCEEERRCLFHDLFSEITPPWI